MNLNDKKFRTLENTSGVSSNDTIFHYFQHGENITGTYKGGAIVTGSLVGKQIDATHIELLFQCITEAHELKAGRSKGVISQNANGNLRLTFDWNWLHGGEGGGVSHYIEIA